MAIINKFTGTDYVRDTKAIESPCNGSPGKVSSNKEAEVRSTSDDSFKTANPEVLSTKTNNREYIRSNLKVDIQDKDGFANFGKADLRAKVSGEVVITKDFVLEQLAKMKDKPDQKFNPPRFDPDRQQFVISGKAIDAALGFIDVNFEIRIGVKDEGLAFIVDSKLTRSSIYSDLKKQMLDAGIDTYEKDGNLYLKPTIGQSFDVPVSPAKNHTARIDWINTNQTNTKTTIDKNGNVSVKLDQVQMIASSDIGKVNAKAAKADVASIKFDFSLDEKMTPNATFSEGSASAAVSEKSMEELIGKENMSYMKQLFGTALSASLTGLGGKLSFADNGLNLEAKAKVNVSSAEGSQIDTKLTVTLADKKPVIEADKFNGNLRNEQRIIADHVLYDGRKDNFSTEITGLDAKVDIEGVKGIANGNAVISTDDSGNLSAAFSGRTAGNVNRDGLNANFSTNGRHLVSAGDRQLNIEVDEAKMSGNYTTVTRQKELIIEEKKAPEDGSAKNKKEPLKVNVNVAKADASANIKTKDLDISASLKNGGVKAEIGKEVKVTTDTDISGSIKGEKVNGSLVAKGADFKLNEDLSADINAYQVKGSGGFNNKQNQLKIGGKVDGDVNVRMSKDLDVDVQTTNGKVSANFSKGRNIDVKATAKEVDFAIDNKQEQISIDLRGVDGTTKFNKEKIKLTAKTKGNVSVDVNETENQIKIKSEKSSSTADFNLNNGLIGLKGKTGDVTVEIKGEGANETVTVDLKKADLKGAVNTKNGKISVGVETKADARLFVSPGANLIDVSSKNGQTKVDFKHDVAQVKAQGTDFSVKVINDQDVDVKLKKASFSGKVQTKNENVKVDINSTTGSDVKVFVANDGESVKVSSGSALQGEAKIGKKEEFKTKFENKNGFTLNVKSPDESTNLSADVKGIKVDGGFNSEKVGVGLNGKGDFFLNIAETPDKSDVRISYKGDAAGPVRLSDQAKGDYALNGDFNIDISGGKIKVGAEGNANARLKDKSGISAEVSVDGTKEKPISVSVDEESGKVSADLLNGGYIKLKNLDQLSLGANQDPTVKFFLENLKSKNVDLYFQQLSVKDNAESVSVNVQSSDIETKLGTARTRLKIDKSGEEVLLDQSYVSFKPNQEFFKLIQSAVGKNFRINFDEPPVIENGELKIKGELRSRLGLVQYADFNIKATVVDNDLVLDLNRAKVFKVIGEGSVGKVVNHILTKADIDATRIGKNTIKITLADLVKDLSLTEGINFTGLKFSGDQAIIGLKFNSIDKKISGFAKKEDVSGLYQYLLETEFRKISSEGLATAYQTYTKEKDVSKASELMAKVVTTYNNDPQIDKADYERALVWISRNQVAKKAHIDDNVTLDFTKRIGVGTSLGDQLIKGLPKLVVQNLADNLDQTISQGGGFSIIYPEERNKANYLRSLKGIPANNRQF